MSIKDKIKAAQDIKSKVVKIPAWDVSVEVREFSLAERDEIIKLQQVDEGMPEGTATWEVLKRCCYDPETKEPIFVDEDREWFFKKGATSTDVLKKAALTINGLGVGAIEEAEKNLE